MARENERNFEDRKEACEGEPKLGALRSRRRVGTINAAQFDRTP